MNYGAQISGTETKYFTTSDELWNEILDAKINNHK